MCHTYINICIYTYIYVYIYRCGCRLPDLHRTIIRIWTIYIYIYIYIHITNVCIQVVFHSLYAHYTFTSMYTAVFMRTPSNQNVRHFAWKSYIYIYIYIYTYTFTYAYYGDTYVSAHELKLAFWVLAHIRCTHA